MLQLTPDEEELVRTLRAIPVGDRTFYQQRVVEIASLIEMKEREVNNDYTRLRLRIESLHEIQSA